MNKISIGFDAVELLIFNTFSYSLPIWVRGEGKLINRLHPISTNTRPFAPIQETGKTKGEREAER